MIIGDGNAGATAAENIRKEDEEASITVLTDEDEALYNRIMLKNFMKGTLPKQYAQVHDEGWYEKRDIDLHLETRVSSVDTDEKVVEAGDEEFSYEKLLVATGGSPREFPADDDFDNVHYMWTMHDAENIKNAAEDSEEAVVIGGGLLGIDLAIAFAENGADTHYIIREDNWWHRGLDPEGAEIIHSRLEDLGVNIVTNTEIVDFESENSEVVAAEASDGEVFECDNVAVAIGQTPNSEFIDVEKTDGGLIKTDEYLRTSEDDVFAAGNMVEYYSPIFEKRTVKGSWDHSEAMGESAAENMMSSEEVFDYVNTYGVGHFDVQFLAIGDWGGEGVSRRYSDDEYRRLIFDGNQLVGAVMIGYTKGQEKLKDLIYDQEEFEDKEKLLDKDFWE
ncbi:Pyridine nucleotide-disulfide oxidoreductase, NADH oxidase [Candidatus Nanohalovita haloferacivicina]|nr:Pyridine nucleotide-disulfide oxidoreductase, NADH oxidase [Candidatus Nanohalobia archaeon BNXNv]